MLEEPRYARRADLRRRLERDARKSDRSLNAEIVERLEHSVRNEDNRAERAMIDHAVLEYMRSQADLSELFEKVARDISKAIEKEEG